MYQIRVQTEAFDVAAEQQALWAGRPKVGAVVSFLGLTRDCQAGARVRRLTLEHYPGMTEKVLEALAEEAARRWSLEGIRIVHRVGALRPQDPIVCVAVAAVHRGEAFRACEFLMDALKTRAPFWKKEETDTGARWVEARPGDEQAAARWQE